MSCAAAVIFVFPLRFLLAWCPPPGILPSSAGEVTPKAAEGAREMLPAEAGAENEDFRDAPLRYAPSTMLRMVLLPHKWGRIRLDQSRRCHFVSDRLYTYAPPVSRW